MKVIFSVLCFFFLSSCTNEIHQDKLSNVKNEDSLAFRLLRTGIPPTPEYEQALALVSQKWGIEYFWVAGCIVADNLSDSIEKCNQKVEKRIQEKYGKDWHFQFHEEVRQQIILDSIKNNR